MNIESRGNAPLFEQLKELLADETDRPSQADIAAESGNDGERG